MLKKIFLTADISLRGTSRTLLILLNQSKNNLEKTNLKKCHPFLEIKSFPLFTDCSVADCMSESDEDVTILLHSETCEQLDSDIEDMRRKLQDDPSCLEYKSSQEEYHYTPLQKAVQAKHQKCIEFLLDSGANINSKNNFGVTALQLALGLTEGFGIAEFLLKKGASANFQPRENDPGYNRTSNLILVSSNPSSINKLKLLLNYGAITEDLSNMETTTYYFFHTPLSVTVFHCNLAALKVLLLHGAIADIRQVKSTNIAPDLIDRHSLPHILVQYCTKSSDLKKVAFEMLQQFGVDIQQRNRNNVTTKEYVVRMGRNGQATDEYVKSMVQIIDDLTRKPLTLQSLCRVAIKDSIGKGYVNKLPNLPYLPPQVTGFLKYDEYRF